MNKKVSSNYTAKNKCQPIAGKLVLMVFCFLCFAYQKTKSDDESQKNSAKLIQISKNIDALELEKNITQKNWQKLLITSLNIEQDIYAMKWSINSNSLDKKILNQQKNDSTMSIAICELWEGLCDKLSTNPKLAPQRATILIRLAQAYSNLGKIHKIDLDAIDWKSSGIQSQKAEIAARIWFVVALKLVEEGKLNKANQYLIKAKSFTSEIKMTPEKINYFSAIIHLLEANITISTNPAKALTIYIKAIEKLSKIVTTIPNNLKLRTALIQACLDGAMLCQNGSNTEQAKKLKNIALKHINSLLKKSPDFKKANLLYAEIKIREAEQMLQKGEHYNASKLLNSAREHIKSGGESILLTAEADGSQAFIHWDHGERKKAMSIINLAIERLEKFKKSEPKNTEIDYQQASLYWIRSSMQLKPGIAIADGRKSASYLLKLVKKGARRREASARRMIAIIYGDIGHQAYSSKQKTVAKQYFQQAQKQWQYLTKNWGTCDEYKEGVRWCSWRMKTL